MPTGRLPGDSASTSARDAIRSQVDALFKSVTTERPRDLECAADFEVRVALTTTDEETAEPLPP